MAQSPIDNISVSNLDSASIRSLIHSDKDALKLATKLMIANRSRLSNSITSELLENLLKEGRFNSPFGLQARLIHGESLIHTDMNRGRFDFLWQLRDDSKAHKQWDVFVDALRIIASILEYSQRSQQSLESLREAHTVIKKYKLETSYPGFAIRIASWHRNFGNQDSSLFYSQEALRTAQKLNIEIVEAHGHLLMGLNSSKLNDLETAAHHFKKGAELYRKLENFSLFCSMHMNLAQVALKKKHPKEALMHLDTALHYHPIPTDNNINQIHRIYKLKGNTFQLLGKADSAIYSFQKGHSIELEYLKAENREKVVEIDNIYNVEKKEQELAAKNKEIRTEKERQRWFLTLSLMVLLFFSILLFYYFKLRKANKLSRQQAEKLKTLDKMKSRFFENVSHELRTPVTLILGPVKMLLKDRNLDPKHIKLLKMVNQSGEQLHQLVDQILDLRKLEMGKMVLKSEPIVLSTFFYRFTSQFESLAVQKRLDFFIESKVNDHIVVNIDPEKFRQILQNILSNAFKLTPAGGQVHVKQELNNSILSLEISDTGPGIHPEELPHVFDRFFQTNRLDKPAEGGTGIGLALCREYAKLFGGDIQVKSTLGEGATFLMSFPVEIVDETSRNSILDVKEAKTLSITAPLNGSSSFVPITKTKLKPTVMVVEDNYELQAYVHLILEEKYKIVQAGNGKEALEYINSHLKTLPDLILSDLMMPMMDGAELLEIIKSDDNTRHIPVIMLTARAEQRDKLNALRIGVDDYLTKPFDEDELLARIDNLIKNQALRRTLILSDTKSISESERPVFSKPDLEWLEAFESYIQQNYSDSTLSVPELASTFAMSQSTLLRQLKRLTGMTPVKYIQEVRLDQARQLLETRSYDSVNIVADKVGYREVRSFSRSFKKRYGKFPSELL